MLNVGGNVRTVGAKADGSEWLVGIENPLGDSSEPYTEYIRLAGESVVTSGSYQRYYVVDGKRYHHIIDPNTLYPSEYWRSVTILCADSGLADALSTALFLRPLEEGQRLLDACESYAMWIDADGEMFYSEGFEELIRT